MKSQQSPFGFTEAWFTLGVVTPERLATLQAAWEQSGDRNPEHYRWRAFQELLAERRPLPPDLAAALYELGERDPDAMGASMMDTIVRLPECPDHVLDAAAQSGRAHLARLVARRRSE